MIAPGTALREGIESILHARTGGLIVIGEPEDLSFLNSGGIKLEIDYTPAFLYQIAKMDGAIISSALIKPGSGLTSLSRSSPDRGATILHSRAFSNPLAARTLDASPYGTWGSARWRGTGE